MLVLAGGSLVVGFGLGYGLRGSGLQIETRGPAPNAYLNAAALHGLLFTVQVNRPESIPSATVTLDGNDVTADADVAGDALVYRPPHLPDGTHRLTVSMDQPIVPWAARRTWVFTIDRVRPTITITGGLRGNVRDRPATIRGVVSEPVTLTADGRPVPLVGRRFALTFARPPGAQVMFLATDRAGNRSGLRVRVGVVPRRPARPVRAVHVSAAGWADTALRGPVMRMIDSGLLTAVELDLKDENGVVGFDSRVPLARRIGAVRPEYNLRQAVRELHAKGVRVIGRIVCFRDPILAGWAWQHGLRDEVVQTPQGGEFSPAIGFTNFANPAVDAYNVAIAREAAKAGVDDILYDYVRRPDGPIDSMRFPGIRGTPQDGVVRFVARTSRALAGTGTELGASVFGVAASRPDEVAQNVQRMAPYLDYVAPLVYPSHWGAGEYGVPDPNREPGLIVRRSLKDFRTETAGTGARVVPWLQDFDLGVHYGPAQVQAQIDAARSLGIDEWILWNANVTYTTRGLRR
jgi:hypothetical protein